nr:unnamed protein product [Haemonchus contortus]
MLFVVFFCDAIRLGIKVGAILIETGLFPNVNPYVERFQEIWVRVGLLRSARYLRLVRRKIVSVPIIQPGAVSSHLSCYGRSDRGSGVSSAFYKAAAVHSSST